VLTDRRGRSRAGRTGVSTMSIRDVMTGRTVDVSLVLFDAHTRRLL
jgi:hypothetical protein